MNKRILVIEDEVKIANFIKRGLKEEGYEVEIALDGKEGLEMASNQLFDLLVLDVMLPEMDGMEVCRQYRGRGKSTPIIMLTAKDSVSDKVQGLDLGADDYMTKPFAFEEFLARVRSHMRKAEQKAETTLRIADLVLDTRTRRVERSGDVVDLSTKELALLQFMMERAGTVLTRTQISEQVWDIHFDTTTNVIDVHINRLRKKVDQDYEPKLIHTIRGSGYMISEDPQP